MTIFISAYRNFSIRYILYSNIFSKLQEHNIRIVIFVQDNDVEYYKKKLSDTNVHVEPIFSKETMKLLKGSRLSMFFVLTRKFMSGSYKNNRNTTDDVMLYQYRYSMNNKLIKRIIYWTARWVALMARRSRWLRVIVPKIEGLLYPGKIYDEYFTKYSPSLVIVSSLGYMIDPYLMRSAKRHDVKTVSIIHSWDNPTTKGYRGAEPDYVIAWNDVMKGEVNIYHDIPNEKIFVGGIAHWDFYFTGSYPKETKEAFFKRMQISDKKKIIYYGTSGFVTFRRTFDVVDSILGHIKQGDLGENVQLVVRLHPTYLLKDGKTGDMHIEKYRPRMKMLECMYKGLIHFDLPRMNSLDDDIDMPKEDMYQHASLLRYSSVLLTEYSTLMIEAAIFDLPIINVGLYNFRDTDKPVSYVENFTHIRRLLSTKASKNAYSMDELLGYIKKYMNSPNADSENREKLVRQEVTTNRGTAGIKIGQYLLELVR